MFYDIKNRNKNECKNYREINTNISLCQNIRKNDEKEHTVNTG